MKQLFSTLFGKKPAEPFRNTQSSRSLSRDNPPTITDGSENATRRQLVQVVLRDLLRRHGIPAEWMDCQMLLVSSQSRGAGMFVRLIVKHWDDRLMHYAVAFQNELRDHITRFDPRCAAWLHGISWELDVGDSCPNATLPDKTFWQEPVRLRSASGAIPTLNTPPVGVAPPAAPRARRPVNVPEAEARQDLDKLFAIRDKALSQSVDGAGTPVGYETTQPAKL